MANAWLTNFQWGELQYNCMTESAIAEQLTAASDDIQRMCDEYKTMEATSDSQRSSRIRVLCNDAKKKWSNVDWP